MTWIADYLADGERRAAEELARVEREAIASGKEPFALATLERHLNRGPQTTREADHRANYYIFHPKLRTVAEYARALLDAEPFGGGL